MSSARVTATHRRLLYVRDEAGREQPARFGKRGDDVKRRAV